MTRLSGLLAALVIGAGPLLAGCGDSRHSLVVRVTATSSPAGSGLVLIAGEPGPRGTSVPLSMVTAAIPAHLPRPVAQSACPAGGAVVTVTTSFGSSTILSGKRVPNERTVSYGPCERPAAIEQLRLAMLSAYRAIRRPIPGAPAATPLWLTEMVWARASNLGDPHPEKIVVSLGVVDRYGRVFDRVWMRGTFTMECPSLGCHGSVHGRAIVGFTVDPKTRQSVSDSWHGLGPA